jgi:dTDP-L-rhamnose 4-epimerase
VALSADSSKIRLMRTLVTGGAGFIGTHLVKRLLDLDEQVVVLDSFESQVHGDGGWPLSNDVELIVGDVGDASASDRALAGVDRIVHLAAVVGVGQSMYEIERYTRMNTMATATFLERMVAATERPRRLVVASSMSIYGEGEYECRDHGRVAPGPRPDSQLSERQWECRCPICGHELVPIGTAETKPLIPTSVYAIGKRDHEELSLVVGAAYGIATTALRFFNVYGPGQALSNPYTGVAAIFASRLINRRSPVIFEDGRQSRDFIHVDDIVEGIVLALDSDDADGRAINLGTGRRVTIEEVAGALSAGLGLEIEPEYPEQYRAGDIRHCYADATLAQDVLGFHAGTTLEEGMADLVQWLADQHADDHVDDATRELERRGLAR